MECIPTFNFAKPEEKQTLKLFSLCKKKTIKTEITTSTADVESTADLCESSNPDSICKKIKDLDGTRFSKF